MKVKGLSRKHSRSKPCKARGKSDGLEIIAGIAEVDPLVFQARGFRCLLELAQLRRRGYAPQITGLELS